MSRKICPWAEILRQIFSKGLSFDSAQDGSKDGEPVEPCPYDGRFAPCYPESLGEIFPQTPLLDCIQQTYNFLCNQAVI